MNSPRCKRHFDTRLRVCACPAHASTPRTKSRRLQRANESCEMKHFQLSMKSTSRANFATLQRDLRRRESKFLDGSSTDARIRSTGLQMSWCALPPYRIINRASWQQLPPPAFPPAQRQIPRADARAQSHSPCRAQMLSCSADDARQAHQLIKCCLDMISLKCPDFSIRVNVITGRHKELSRSNRTCIEN